MTTIMGEVMLVTAFQGRLLSFMLFDKGISTLQNIFLSKGLILLLQVLWVPHLYTMLPE